MHPLVQLLASLGHLVGGGAPAANPGLVNAINHATGFTPPAPIAAPNPQLVNSINHATGFQPPAPVAAPNPMLLNNINRMTGQTPGAVPLQPLHQPAEAPHFPPGFFQPLPHYQVPDWLLKPLSLKPQQPTAGQPRVEQPNLNSMMFQPPRPQQVQSQVPDYLNDLYHRLGGQI